MKIISLSAFVLLFSTCAAELRGSTTAHRQGQASVGKVKELRWVNADTNLPVSINGSPIVPIQPEGPFANAIDGYELPSGQLTIEAMVEDGPVGSVKFSFNGATIIENNAPYALCANVGADFLPCQGLRDSGGVVTAQAFAGKGATGASSAMLSTFIVISYKVAPFGTIHYVNSQTDVDLGICGSAVISLTVTPSVGFFVDQWARQGQWVAESTRFVYDNGAQVVVANSRPLVFPGNIGTDYLGIVPTIGSHSIVATLHSKKDLMGQNVTWTCNFEVVA